VKAKLKIEILERTFNTYIYTKSRSFKKQIVVIRMFR